MRLRRLSMAAARLERGPRRWMSVLLVCLSCRAEEQRSVQAGQSRCLEVTDMKMLSFPPGVTRMDRIRDENENDLPARAGRDGSDMSGGGTGNVSVEGC